MLSWAMRMIYYSFNFWITLCIQKVNDHRKWTGLFFVWWGFFGWLDFKFTNNSGKNRKHIFHQDPTSMSAASMLDCTDRKPAYQYEGISQLLDEKLKQVSVGKRKKKRIWSRYFSLYMCIHMLMYMWGVKNAFDLRGNQDLVLLSLFPGAANFLQE